MEPRSAGSENSSLIVQNAGCSLERFPCRGPSTSAILTSSGALASVSVSDSSYFELDRGTVLGDVTALESALVVLGGGAVAGAVNAFHTSTVWIVGSHSLDPIGQSLNAFHSSTINLLGTDFAVGGVPVGPGPIPVS